LNPLVVVNELASLCLHTSYMKAHHNTEMVFCGVRPQLV
jgi:hypothetical protein